MRACNSWGKAGRPGLELQRQNQRVNVSGFTMLKAECQSNQRERQTIASRIALVACCGLT
jgi:hypothetical protein